MRRRSKVGLLLLLGRVRLRHQKPAYTFSENDVDQTNHFDG
jgi:hypothetical protein